MMSLTMKQLSVRPWALWTMATLTCISEAALVAITVALATDNTSSGRSIHRVALAASFGDILSIPASISVAFLYQRRMGQHTRTILLSTFTALTVFAAVLTIYTLAWTWNNIHGDDRGYGFQVSVALTATGFTMWIIAVASQIMLYTVVLSAKVTTRTLTPVQEHLDLGRTSPSQSVKRSDSISNPADTSISLPRMHPEADPVLSSAFSAYSASPRSSFRNSVTKALRPVTSRTRLILQHSFILPDSRTPPPRSGTPFPGCRETDGFEDWDDVPATEAGKTVKLPLQFKKHQLEPIPASRAGSPASALQQRSPTPYGFPPLPSPTGSSSEFSSLTAPMRSHSPRENDADQSRIHPLFRSDSPTAPPVVSPDTVITASPYAGQVVSPEHQPYAPRRSQSSQRTLSRVSSPLSPSTSAKCLRRPSSVLAEERDDEVPAASPVRHSKRKADDAFPFR